MILLHGTNQDLCAMDKVKFLTDLIVQEIMAFIVEDRAIEYDEAIDLFYKSQTFEKLADEETGLYRESAAYVYELFKSELKNGKITLIDQ